MEQGLEEGGPGFPPRVRGVLARLFEIDVRALAAVRIGLALVMLIDLCGRASSLAELYSDQGFTPRAMFAQGQVRFSPYFWAGGTAWAGALFALHGAFAIAMLVGFRTRATILACLALTWAVNDRNPIAAHAGDGLLLWTMAWLLFLPAGAAAAVDAVTARATVPRTVCSPATAGLLLQVVFVYFGAVHAKLRTGAWMDLSAVGTFMQLHYATPLGVALGGHYGLTKLLTAGTVLLELLGPPVALFCARAPRVRIAIVVSFLLFHLALAMTLYVGTFALVCAVVWLAFLPAGVWDAVPGPALRAWRGVVVRLAAAIERGGSFIGRLAVRDASTGRGRLATTAAALTLAYLTAVNAVENLSYGRRSPLLPQLPRAKQRWDVMARPTNESITLVVLARLRDGSEVTLYPGEVRPPTWKDYLWPPDSARSLVCRLSVLGGGFRGQVAGVRRFAEREAARWDDARPPEQRVAEVRVVGELRRVLRPDRVALPESLTLAARTRRLPVWKSDPPPPDVRTVGRR